MPIADAYMYRFRLTYPWAVRSLQSYLSVTIAQDPVIIAIHTFSGSGRDLLLNGRIIHSPMILGSTMLHKIIVAALHGVIDILCE